ncbi:MAG TPA: hypothetical protein V6C58_09550, partial [Allocoleopsis sp.]
SAPISLVLINSFFAIALTTYHNYNSHNLIIIKNMPLLNINEQFLTHNQGNKIAVVIDLETYQKMLDDLDEFYCEKGYEQAIIETESEINQSDYHKSHGWLNTGFLAKGAIAP